MTTPTPCDTLLRAGHVLTQNAGREALTDAGIAMQSGTVLAVGPWAEVAAAHQAAEVMELPRCLVLPGLVNAHTHASMSIFRGVADDLPLMEWLTKHIWPREQKLTPEIIHLGALLACAEMIRTGTTCLCDMYLVEDETARAVDASGLRGVLGEGLFVFPSPAYDTVEQAFALVEAFAERWRGHPRVRLCMAPHAPYTTNPDILTRSHALAKRENAVWNIHLAESARETAEALEQLGKRPLAYLDGLGVVDEHTLLAHGVDLNDDELALLAERGASVVHCPQSNMKLASGIARTQAMLEAGVNIALGTDGAASNNGLNMFGEMKAAALLQKVATMDPTAISAGQALDMATLGGARALGWPELGRLEPGSAADLVALDLDAPNLTPMYNADSHAVYAATGHEAVMTMVAGKVLYRDGKYETLDYEALLKEAEAVADWVRKLA